MKKYHFFFTAILITGLLLAPHLSFAQEGLIPCGHIDESTNKLVECNFGHVIQLVETIIDFLIFTLAFPIATALFAYAGILMITAGGKEDQIKKAKRVFYHVAVGLLIMLAAWLIVYTITNTLIKDDFLPAETRLNP